MKLDVHALGSFYRMASEGAEQATDRLRRMTGVRARVDRTTLNFMPAEAVEREVVRGADYVGVRVGLSGGPGGHAVFVFDRASAHRLIDAGVQEVAVGGFDGLLPAAPGDDFDEMGRSAVKELGNIMNSGFIDGWADALDTVIDVSTPEYLDEGSPAALLEAISGGDGEEVAILFQSSVSSVDAEVGFRHYLFPESESMKEVFASQTEPEGVGFEFEKLVGFDRMADQGTAEVADNLSMMTGFDTTVEIRRLNFVAVETIPEEVSEERQVAVAFRFDGLPSGYLVFMFDEESAREVVAALVSSPDGDGLDAMGRSAVEELANIMASGFLDGWANVLRTSIDHTTPEFVHDMGPAVIDPIVVELGQVQDFAFLFDTRIRAADRAFDVSIYAIPDEGALERALSELDLDAIEGTYATPSFTAETARVETAPEEIPDEAARRENEP